MKSAQSWLQHLLLLALALAWTPFARANTYTETVNGVAWTYAVYDGEASVGGGSSLPAVSTNTSGAIVIPSTLGGHPVTSIGNSAFYDCLGLTSVMIPDSVTSIGDSAFYGCSGLMRMTIPHSVTNIGYFAFDGCSDLTDVTISDSVTRIESFAFFGCSSLTSVTIPNSVTRIGRSAFRDCSGLTSVTIGNGVTSIESGAFSDCICLTSVTIGNGVTSIEGEAFFGCSGLTSITIPDSVTRIDDNAFSSCSGLRNVMLGNGVTNIGNRAFYNCHSMEAFSVSRGNPSYQSVSGLLLTKDGKTLLYGVNGDVVIPDGVTDITDYAFLNCGDLTSIVIPESVVQLPTTAFDGCNKLWTSWYRTLANLSAGSGSFPSVGNTVSLTVTNLIVHYVTQSRPSGAVTPDTASAGIVNIVAEVTANKAVAISQEWADQYPAFAATFGPDFSAALTKPTGKRDGIGNPMYVWQDYVAGTDPTDPTSVFTASVTFDAETGAPVVSWSPELTPAEAAKRIYTVYGKVRMTDPDWLPVADDPSPYNFFRLTVEMK